MNVILYDSDVRDHLLPFTYTRPVADLRIGILTLREKWENWLGVTSSTLTQEYLSEQWPVELAEDNLFIDGALQPDAALVQALRELAAGECLESNGTVLAYRSSDVAPDPKNTLRLVQYQAEARRIERNWDLFSLNHAAIKADFELLTAGRESQPVPKGVTVIGDGDVFLEEGASVLPGMLNTTEGPIYLGRNSQVMEACAIRGPFALCEGAIVKMGAKIYTGTTIGPYSKVGGEVNNSILMGYSNKGHDGFLGNSVLGEWCNLGADTNTSNMKNNYTEIRLWDYADGRFSPTGLQFCGLMMGDHSKTGINTMLNTGTVIGVSCNVFGSGYPRNFIPSFSWGSGSGMSVYKTAKAFETAEAMMKRRGVEFDEADKAILEYVFEASSSLRRY